MFTPAIIYHSRHNNPRYYTLWEGALALDKFGVRQNKDKSLSQYSREPPDMLRTNIVDPRTTWELSGEPPHDPPGQLKTQL